MRRGSTAGRRSWQGRRKRLWLAVVVAVVAAAGTALAEDEAPVISQAEIEAIERETVDEGVALISKSGGVVTCGDNYLEGKYEDIVRNYHELSNGIPALRVNTEFEACLAASSHNCSNTTTIYLKGSHQTEAWRNATVSRWNARLLVAEALGYDVKLFWMQSNFSGWNVCVLERLLVWALPHSGQ